MSFGKAAQYPKNDAATRAREEYSVAFSVYREQCALNAKLRTALQSAVGAGDKEAKLLFLEQKELFRSQCRVYKHAQDTWAQACLREKLGPAYKTARPLSLAKALDVQVPLSGRELITEGGQFLVPPSNAGDITPAKLESLRLEILKELGRTPAPKLQVGMVQVD